MIIIDIETTGLSPETHSIIDLAAIEFENPSNRYVSRAFPRTNTTHDSNALEYNGFKVEDIYDSKHPLISKILVEFDAWTKTVKERTLAGQNPDFDVNFLKFNYELHGMTWYLGHRKVDQHSLAYAKAMQTGYNIPLTDHQTTGFNSDEIMKFVGIPAEPKPHNSALNGAIWETEAFSRLINGKNLLEEFKDNQVPEYLR